MLVEEAKQGSNEAFAKLIEENKLKIYKTAKAILKNEEDACDAIQETLVSIYRNLHNLKDDKFFTSWVIKITINKSYDIIAKRELYNRKIQKVAETQKGSRLELTSEEKFIEKSEVEEALDGLEEDLRLVTVLYYYDGLSIKQISNILDIPIGTVKSKLARARNKLYDMLQRKDGE